jgi:hypothetical protein
VGIQRCVVPVEGLTRQLVLSRYPAHCGFWLVVTLANCTNSCTKHYDCINICTSPVPPADAIQAIPAAQSFRLPAAHMGVASLVMLVTGPISHT